MSILTVIDTSGTQSYIFGSNRLRESIGASEIVSQTTSRWVFDVIKDFEKEKNWQHNLYAEKKPNPFDEIDGSKTKGLQAEVIYCGGGNALILFDEIGNAKEFSRKYTRKLLENASNMRPISLDERELADDDWRTWQDFESIISEFQGHVPKTDDRENPNWREKRNKVKALREALRNGKMATEKFLTHYNTGLLPKLTIKNKEELRKKGWDSSICVYFDAIEMLDLFCRMTKEAHNGDSQ